MFSFRPRFELPQPTFGPKWLTETFFAIAVVLNVVPRIWEFLKSFAAIERRPTNIAESVKEELKKVELSMMAAGKCRLVMEDALERQLFVSDKVEFEGIKEAQYNATLASLRVQKAKKTWRNLVMFNNEWLETVLGRGFYRHQICLIRARELDAAFKELVLKSQGYLYSKNVWLEVWLEAFEHYLGA
ncbi:hypothetical protein C8R43DRAFT_1142466 [Mycena crocata]|nr:hypothetical protein C8R43DRAFT_1142466 [Mycena crocata]